MSFATTKPDSDKSSDSQLLCFSFFKDGGSFWETCSGLSFWGLPQRLFLELVSSELLCFGNIEASPPEKLEHSNSNYVTIEESVFLTKSTRHLAGEKVELYVRFQTTASII